VDQGRKALIAILPCPVSEFHWLLTGENFMVVGRHWQGRIPYSGGVTGLVAGARVDPEVGWDENPGAHDHDVELVLAFLNTIDVEQGTDVLTEPGRWQDWVSGLRFEPPRPTIGRTGRSSRSERCGTRYGPP